MNLYAKHGIPYKKLYIYFVIESLIGFITATIILALSPGPDNIFVLTQSLSYGIKSGIAITARLISGCIVHTTLLAFGISAIITASETAFLIVKIIGATYLLYLAYKVYKSDATIVLKQTNTETSYRKLFLTGVYMNLVNPKVLLFFLAFFPVFLWNENENTVHQFYILGVVFMITSFLVFSLIAVLAGSISSFLKQSTRVGIFLKWLQILVFVGIAVYFLLDF